MRLRRGGHRTEESSIILVRAARVCGAIRNAQDDRAVRTVGKSRGENEHVGSSHGKGGWNARTSRTAVGYVEILEGPSVPIKALLNAMIAEHAQVGREILNPRAVTK